jgi:hypothetical protein
LLSHKSASARSQTTVVNGRRKEIVSALSTLWGKVASNVELFELWDKSRRVDIYGRSGELGGHLYFGYSQSSRLFTMA